MAYEFGPQAAPRTTAAVNLPQWNPQAQTGSISGTATGHDVTVEPPLSLELSYVSNHLTELQMELDALERQLQPVMLPCAPDSPGKPDAPNATRGIVVDALSAFTSRLQSIRSQVVRLRGQLTV